ncbi:ral guanine nucleotide dissociation stimulator-like [Heterocephalus glaber]|uniref:Ral guanine nucleotide dissociation stimulator-like n=1 Tax=Heterocephalus glaber TaxID=10181 RepID=A0AAX6RTM2_HETGA|nr:ral guanine nucleotide dissociation stimulator-like [Heterocephalus glaber]
MPGSDLEHCAHLLLAQLKDTQTMKAKPGGEEAWDVSIKAHEEAQAAAPVPGPTGEREAAPAAASKPAVDPPPILGQELAAVPAPWPGAPRKLPWVIPKKKQTGTETLELEPATAGPLLPVVPSWPSPMTMKTRDSTWLQQGKKAKEQLPASICTTVIHLPSVSSAPSSGTTS